MMAKNGDLFGNAARKDTQPRAAPVLPVRRGTSPPTTTPDEAGYTAASIEVLEGLEPVRRRPGMYIGGTDEAALHHLFAEAIDNAMDEAVAGHATFIDVTLEADGFLAVIDNGRGIPIDPHPKFPKKSALEVIMTTLHAGGKFDSGAYQTSGGLHGVGISVVNALSERLEVEVARGQILYRQVFERGHPTGKLEQLGKIQNRRGTRVRFKPDEQIFGKGARFKPARVFRMTRSKAYLFGGVEIRWHCAPDLVAGSDIPPEATFRFPGGLKDYLVQDIAGKELVADQLFAGKVTRPGGHGSLEWGDRLARRRRRLRPFLLQHDPDERRRHARGRPADGPASRPQGPRRAHRTDEARRDPDQRRRPWSRARRWSRSSSRIRSSRARTKGA